MSDLISRQAAKLKVARVIWEDGDSCYDFHDKCVDCLDDVPSAQPEIIHCEFCEHWKNNHLCECLSRYGTFDTPKDFFCGYGKAKNDSD